METENMMVKIVLTEDQKRDLSNKIAQSLCDYERVEDEKKAVMSDFKAKLDRLKSEYNELARHINNGYIFEHRDCEKRENIAKRCWEFIHPISGEVFLTKPMTQDDMQLEI